MSTCRKNIKQSSTLTIDAVIDLLRIFSNNAIAGSCANKIIEKLQDLFSLDEEALSSLSIQLNKDARDNSFANINVGGISFCNVLHQVIAAFEAEKPLVTIDFITREKISAENRFMTSDRYQFDINTLVYWLNQHFDSNPSNLTNPWTNTIFSETDLKSIVKAATARGLILNGAALVAAKNGYTTVIVELAGFFNDQQRIRMLPLIEKERKTPGVISHIVSLHFSSNLMPAFNSSVWPLVAGVAYSLVTAVSALLSHENHASSVESKIAEQWLSASWLLSWGLRMTAVTTVSFCIKKYYRMTQLNIISPRLVAEVVNNANLNVPVKGIVPLFFAVTGGHVRIIDLLLKQGADANATTVEGISALMYAAISGHTQVVDLLLKRGAIPDITTAAGLTALFFASQYGHLDIVKLLIQKGANIKMASTCSIRSLLEFAETNHVEEQMMALIREKNISSNEVLSLTEVSMIAIEIAIVMGHHDIVKLLRTPTEKLSTYGQGLFDTSLMHPESSSSICSLTPASP